MSGYKPWPSEQECLARQSERAERIAELEEREGWWRELERATVQRAAASKRGDEQREHIWGNTVRSLRQRLGLEGGE